MSKTTETITLTFGDVAEAGPGMHKIGTLADNGYTLGDLVAMRQAFPGHPAKLIRINGLIDDFDFKCEELVNATEAAPSAFLLVVRGAVATLLGKENIPEIIKEMKSKKWDSKALFRGKVKNKLARHNLVFTDAYQAPDYAKGISTSIAYKDVPLISKLRDKLMELVPDNELNCEGNYYYKSGTGIGYHGDTERRKVIGARFGSSMSLHFQHFFKGRAIGKNGSVMVHSGDLYMFSEHATGTNWKKRNIVTLRHAAGAKKYTLDRPQFKVVDRQHNEFISKTQFDYMGYVTNKRKRN